MREPVGRGIEKRQIYTRLRGKCDKSIGCLFYRPLPPLSKGIERSRYTLWTKDRLSLPSSLSLPFYIHVACKRSVRLKVGKIGLAFQLLRCRKFREILACVCVCVYARAGFFLRSGDDTTDVRRKTREECFSFLPERTSLERRGGMFNLRRIKRNNGRIVERDIIFTYLDSRSFAISSNNSFPTDLTIVYTLHERSLRKRTRGQDVTISIDTSQRT